MSRLTLRAGAAPALALLALAACGGSTAPEPALAPCTGPVTVQATPLADGGRFTWTPACGLTSLAVPLAPSGGTIGFVWQLQSDTRLIAPGVRYGDQPAGTRTAVPARTLSGGSTFWVWLSGEGGSGVADYQWRT